MFLPDGNPRGVKIAEITSRTIQVILVPRAHLHVAAERPELSNVGVYFLVGETQDGDADQVYVGEAEDCLERLRQHNRTKDFWRVVLVVVSKTQSFTKAHVRYLEWYCHKTIENAGRYPLENATIPQQAFVPEAVVADLMDNFETMQVLISTLGYPLFDEIKAPKTQDLLTCRGRKAEAKGEYTEEGFVVFSESTANVEETRAARGTWVTRLRQPLIDGGVLETDGDVYRFTRNYVFTSPSAAAATVLARHANGWLEWKYPDGRTLDEVKRQGKDSDA